MENKESLRLSEMFRGVEKRFELISKTSDIRDTQIEDLQNLVVEIRQEAFFHDLVIKAIGLSVASYLYIKANDLVAPMIDIVETQIKTLEVGPERLLYERVLN